MTYQPEITDKEIASVKYHLSGHIGSNNRISVEDLTIAVYGAWSTNNKRKLRAVISHINMDDSDKCLILTDRSEGGYFLSGDDPDPALSFIAEEESQALNTLKKISSMRRKVRMLYGRGVIEKQYDGQGRLC